MIWNFIFVTIYGCWSQVDFIDLFKATDCIKKNLNNQ